MMSFDFTPISFSEADLRCAPLRPNFPALAHKLIGHAKSGAWSDKDSGALLLAPRWDLGPKMFGVTLFPPVGTDKIDHFERDSGRRLPLRLRQFYQLANGGFFGDLSIFGLGLELDRATRSPLDLGNGDIWRIRYASCDNEFILFASQNFGPAGQVGYFMSQDGKIVGRGNGKPEAPAHSGEWLDSQHWLLDRLTK